MFWKRKKKAQESQKDIAMQRMMASGDCKKIDAVGDSSHAMSAPVLKKSTVKPMTMTERMPAKASCMSKSTSMLLEKEVTHEDIASRAYQIWQREGCPEGMAAMHWQMALKELKA